MTHNNIKFDKKLLEHGKYFKFRDFHNLMKFHVRDILLVSSLYDSYIFEEDFLLYEMIRNEFRGLNLSHSPELVQVSSGKEALEMIKDEQRFNLIIVTQHVEDMSAVSFAKKIRMETLDIPVVLLGYDNQEMNELLAREDTNKFDNIFIWQGDYRIILGIIKSIEDKKNVESDTEKIGVQSIILIEDNVRFYSSYLPIIYTEILTQSQSLISEGMNLSHKFLRMRARPKILLCSTYEEAWEYFEKYEKFVLGVITDANFLHNGKNDPEAGIKFAVNVKRRQPDIPILLQSTDKKNRKKVERLEISFLLKDSQTLLTDLRQFIINNFGFRDFIFKNADAKVFGRARTLLELEEQVKTIPDESLIYHATRNHFSNWLKARTEFWLAHKLRTSKVSDYKSADALRKYLIKSLRDYRNSSKRGVIIDFEKNSFNVNNSFSRIGGGSLGGKARGLGFINRLLIELEISKKFKDIDISVPPTVVIGTEIFDEFLDSNDLHDFALTCDDDEKLIKKFLEASRFPTNAVKALSEFLSLIFKPLAVRSSSLLEDSQGQPFAGVYETLMIPNNNSDSDIRLQQLLNAVKRIYASTFSQKTKDYIKVTSYRLEEEKMAVIIQPAIGVERNGKFYPEISGVAKSYNFYPTAPLKADDGIVTVAMGLGKVIVEGGETVRFCPRYPRHLLNYGSIDDILKYNQKEFYAINLNHEDKIDLSESDTIVKCDIQQAYLDGAMNKVGSTYSPENNSIHDGVSREGVKLFTMAPILKYHTIPLPEIIETILELSRWGMGTAVEIEFAVNLTPPSNEHKKFNILQIRPLVISEEKEELNVSEYKNKHVIAKSSMVLGNGVIKNISDIVFVDIKKYDRSESLKAAREIAYFNSKLMNKGKRYLLITVGRLGTLDQWLGIPVKWEQITGARAIIESNFKDFDVKPSQGSHFFQNLTSFKVAYFTINSKVKESLIDWEWIRSQEICEAKSSTIHVKTKSPITIIINGRKSEGVVLKPGIV